MKYSLSKAVIFILASTLMFGCTGGGEEAADTGAGQTSGGGTGSGGSQNHAPVAVISAADNANVGDSVSANGNSSSDSDGNSLTYSWQLSTPQGSNVQLSNSTSATISFTPDVAGTYSLSLTVNDGQLNSTTVVHNINVTDNTGGGGGGGGNRAPTAQISVADGVLVGNQVSASGSQSSDPDNDTLTYSWQLAKPAGSNAGLNSSSSENVTFTPDVAGSYTLSLTVNDGQVSSNTASRQIQAQAPLNGQSVVLKSTSASAQSNVPVTFATTFIKGEESMAQQFQLQLATGQVIAVQTNAKASHSDGSLRHAIFSAIMPTVAGQSEVVAQIVPSASAPNAQVASLQTLLNSGWDTTIDLTLGGVQYSASAAQLLAAQSENLWLDGPLVKEWMVHGAFKTAGNAEHPHLYARFNVRVYGNLNNVWVSAVIENNWAYEANPQNFTYSADINVNGQTRYSINDLKHLHNSRWRQTFWSNTAPELHIAHDSTYLIATAAFPNYDASLVGNIKASRISNYDTNWVSETITREIGDNGYDVAIGSGGTQFVFDKIGPMGLGFAESGMPNTGARPDIGPLPQWHAVYLLDQSEVSKRVSVGMGNQAASWPIHYRHKASQLPLSIDDFPYATNKTDPNLSHNPATGLKEQVALCTSTTSADCVVPYRPDTAHQPSLAYVPYLVTGDHYFLEELQFWATFNFIIMNPAYRETDKGLFERALQDRGQAWSMRTLGQTAYITPDSHALKSYFEDKLQSNITKYHDKYVVANPNEYGSLIPNYSHPTHSPWMDDFFTWAIGYIHGMGYDQAKPLLDWKAKFSVQRMGFGSTEAASYCWIFAAPYHLLIAPEKDAPMFQTIDEAYNNTNGQQIPYGGGFNDQGTECASQAQADVLGLQVGEMPGYSASATGFPSNMQIALAVAAETGITGSSDAWQRFMNRTVKPDYTDYPNYAIVPRN